MARYYRIVRQNPPRLEDFHSHQARGIRPRRPLTEDEREQWGGVSAFRTLEAARKIQALMPHLGSQIAALDLAEGHGVRIKRTGRTADHVTIWASPSQLIAAVISVESA